MITVVSVYNNEEILKGNLLKSLKSQSSKLEQILIDNTKGRFKSAAEALNWGGKKAKGKYIMFAHQDVDLCSNSWLEDVENILDSIPELGIAGVAGMSEKGNTRKERGRNIIEHGDPPKIWAEGNTIHKPEPVQTLDECLAIIPKSIFNKLQFDEKVCNNWHLYVVDYCLSVVRLGLSTYAIPMFIYHKSDGIVYKSKVQKVKDIGSLPISYYQTLGKLIKKHKNYYEQIYTTCGTWNTLHPLILQRVQRLSKGGLMLLLRKVQRYCGC